MGLLDPLRPNRLLEVAFSTELHLVEVPCLEQPQPLVVALSRVA
jgi:hypothetical protein